ncbi:MAG: M1 family metallopeptidase [Thermoanaerobaculales bacterium]|jgi:aminopeptidase N|nr:M1 family metallopeptidase [Thermoanaerobaculales bacterium]
MPRLPAWLKAVLLAIPGLLLVAALAIVALGWYVSRQVGSSGGELAPDMAAYDVRHTDLEVQVDPASESIRGRAVVTVDAVAPADVFAIHLDDRLQVVAVRVDGDLADARHADGVISVALDDPWPAGSRHRVGVEYGGAPKKALRAPWIDGFVWSETPSGEPWVGVTCEGDGADIWWPCKDHPSDEPDEGMDIALTVPEGLVGLSNGRPMGETTNPDGTVTSRWRVGFPVNNYAVSIAVGPYVPVEEIYRGVDGSRHETIVFWAIPEHLEEARRMWVQMPRILEIFGRRFGEYPFFSDKLWVAHAPYLGMEHQTLIAYGSDFTDNDYGFDWLLAHELAHEWWGNKVTASDWGDAWLHEGFASYAEALIVLDTVGEAAYLDYMHTLEIRMTNDDPLIKGTNLESMQGLSPDAYGKGAWVLHMLRYLLGDEAMTEILWRVADGDNPAACRFVTTNEFTTVTEEIAGRDLGWFWQRYLHTAELPLWSVTRTGDRVTVAWDDPSFEMPLPVEIDGRRELVAMAGGRAELTVDPQAEVVVDPEREILANRP